MELLDFWLRILIGVLLLLIIGLIFFLPDEPAKCEPDLIEELMADQSIDA